MDENSLWVILVSNFPLILGFVIALNRGYIYMGRTFDREMVNKETEIAFREQLRKEALADKALLEARDRERTEAMRELTNVIEQSLALNEKLVQETIREWDGYDRRRANKTSNTAR